MARLRKAVKIAVIVFGSLLAAMVLLVLLKFGSTAPPTSVLERPTLGQALGTIPRSGTAISTAPGVTLPEYVYFGAAWQMLSKSAGMPPIILGNGYTNARVERTGDGLFFAGVVDRLDRSGAVTDVILAFGGAQGIGDLIQGEALAHDRVLAEPRWAATLLEKIWQDPRYAHARIHVTGHSLGAGYAQFAATEAIARHGIDEAAARLDVVAFGVPNWGPQAARFYHVGPHVLDRLFTGYTALNDPVITNGGTERVGRSHFLPPFVGLTGIGSMFNAVAAHWPTTYMTALGLPDWLTQTQKASCIKRVSSMFITGNSYDPGYRDVVRSGESRSGGVGATSPAESAHTNLNAAN